ncbi:MAG: DMT family transporter [Pseudomonadota bacterium]
MKPGSIFHATLWMTGAIVSFCSMAVAGREVSFALDTFEIMMYRSFVGVVIVFAGLSLTRSWAHVTKRSLGLHGVRNVAHFVGQNLWFYAVTVIPLAQVFALEFTSPLWVLVLSPLLLGERLTRYGVLAALVGFVGILIVARPSPATLNLGLVTAAGSAIFFALSIMFTKRLTRDHSIGCILFYLTVMQSVFGVVCAGIDGDIALPTLETAPWLLLIGCAGLMAHFCLTNALSLVPATVVAPLDFVRLPAIAAVGLALYGEPVDIWVIIGATLIFAGNYINLSTQNVTSHK